MDCAWIRSLRSGSYNPPNTRRSGRVSACNVKRRSSAPRLNFPADRKSTLPECTNLCCTCLSGKGFPFQSYRKTVGANYPPQPFETLQNQISRAQDDAEAYKREIIRLQRIVGACIEPQYRMCTSGKEFTSKIRLLTVSPATKPASGACTHPCCHAGAVVVRASNEMLRLRRIIQILGHRRHQLTTYLHAKRSVASPIRHLPPELLLTIFSFATPEKTDHACLSFTVRRMSQVCRRWRTIVLGASQLWSTVLLTLVKASHVAHLKLYASNAQTLPLTIRCPEFSKKLRVKLTDLSCRWRDITLESIGTSQLDELNAVRGKIPFLKSLHIRVLSPREGWQTNDAFEHAPSLRRVVFTIREEYIWPFSFILPWTQITSLTLYPITLSVFSECIRNCPQLLFLDVNIRPRWTEAVPETEHLTSPLRKLVLRGSRCQEAIVGLTFPHLVSLIIPMDGKPHPEFLPFLARSTHLEMVAVSSWGKATTEHLISILLATPSLRMLHFKDWQTVLVTPRLTDPPAAWLPNSNSQEEEGCVPKKLESLAELKADACVSYPDEFLWGFLRRDTEAHPSFDPHGIDTARLEVPGFPFDPEAELDYLLTTD
ncbi:hypothetical protein FB45DRAFT_918853 [Roridomyces roridus]|uniref:F-box domain-containing protein n=1 Tax=Roridomyces roridus TaxID=1738132 RepID=A0AAD7BRN2_9AGAR|nr:hypothetical protein FB45DRAFT_918853 [Roridomyces roridus]